MRRAAAITICMALLALGSAAPAQGAFDDPLFVLTPQPPSFSFEPTEPPFFGYLDGPCGLAVGPSGAIYISDHYHQAVDVYTPVLEPEEPDFSYDPEYQSQPLSAFSGAPNPHTGPVDDPCGLALDASGALYLNNYHRDVVRFPAPVSLSNPSNVVIDSGDPTDPFANPTGVALSPMTQHPYVDDRTYVAEYDSSGAFVQRIGEGSIGEGYGIAVSGYGPTRGYLYVPDAADEVVEVYDPATSTSLPKATITGPPGGGFGSLTDSAVAVSDGSGEIYVVDTLGPQWSERPQAIVYVFAPNGAFEGRLKLSVINAAPVGLAVDNSGGATQGRVYVTSGISENASLIGYPPGAATNASAPPPAGWGAAGEEAVSVSSPTAAAIAATTPSGASPSTSGAAFAASPSQGKRAMQKRRRHARGNHHRIKHPPGRARR